MVAKHESSLSFRVLSQGPFAFTWAAPAGGHEWRHDLRPPDRPPYDSALTRPSHSVRGPWLVSARAPEVGKPEQIRRYAPLARVDLHRVFASTKPTEAGVLEFADRFGSLGRPVALVTEGDEARAGLAGESFELWDSEIPAMHRLVELWGLVLAARASEYEGRMKPGALARRIVWSPEGRGVYVDWGADGHDTIADEAMGVDVAMLERWRPGELVAPASYFVFRSVNERMRGRVSPALLPEHGDQMALFPHDLLAALYVLFALELPQTRLPMRQCVTCGTFFYPSDKRQRHCRPACRKTKHARAKRKQQKGATT